MPITVADKEKDTLTETLAGPNQGVVAVSKEMKRFPLPQGINVEEQRKEGITYEYDENNNLVQKVQSQESPAPEPAPAPAPATSTAPAPTISTSTAPPPVEAKLYAGKFKTVEDLEKSYEEVQKSFTIKAQEAATARKALEEREKAAPKTPEETETERLTRINEMLANPDKYFAEQARKANEAIVAETKSMREVAAKVEAWREVNKDVAPYEDYIGVVMHRLTTSDPKLDPLAALEQATTAVRAEVGKIREAGRLEALSIQSGATTPAAAKVIVPPPTEHPSPAPMSDQDAYQAHMAELTSNAARVRRPVR